MAQQGHKDRLSGGRRLLPAPGEAGLAHARRRAGVFEGPPPAREDFCAHLESRLRLVPRYRQKLAFPPLEMGRPFWVDDPSFNLDYHVRHTALPKPGSDDQLRQLVGRIFSQRLDRSKPLWEIWIVQGLEGGRFALISKTHHALVDGVSGVDIATVLFDLSPVPAELEPEEDRWTPAPEPSDAELVAEGVKGLVAHAVRPRRARARRRSSTRARRSIACARPPRGSARWSGPGMNPAPDVPLNVPIGPHRRVLLGAEPAGRLQGDQERARRDRERRRAGRGGRRARPLAARPRRAHRGPGAARARAGLDPRASDERGALGNRIAAMRGPLPVYVDDPVERLRDRARGDGRAEGVEAGARRRGDRRAQDFAPPTLLAQASRLNFSTRLFNLIVTNVPGPAVPALPARPRDAGDRADRLPAREPRARDRDHELQRQGRLRAARRLRRDARPRLLRRAPRGVARRAAGGGPQGRQGQRALERQQEGRNARARRRKKTPAS